jgi:hypothetical protein
MHGIDNYTTEILDLAVEGDWKEFTLQPGMGPIIVKSNYEKEELQGRSEITRDELLSDLEALGLDWIISSETGTRWCTHKREDLGMKYVFLVTQDRTNKQGILESHLRLTFKRVSVPFPWTPADDDEEKEGI